MNEGWSRRFGRQLALCVGIVASVAGATGTPSGSIISNVASLRYVQAGDAVQVQSDPARLRVDELLDVVVRPDDATRVAVASPDMRRVLSFDVTNIGNGRQAFRLLPNTILAGGQFDPVIVRVALATNGGHVYDPTTAIDYVAGANDPVLGPDQSITVFVICDIPARRTDGDLGLVSLDAQAVIGTGSPGTLLAGRGAGGSDLVIGSTRGDASAQSGYAVAQLQVRLLKSQVVSNGGGSVVGPGSVITYTLLLQLAGSGSLVNGLIADPLPANTSYVAGSLSLDGATLSDQADLDAGRFTGNAIEVRLGALAAPASHSVTFQVRLN